MFPQTPVVRSERGAQRVTPSRLEFSHRISRSTCRFYYGLVEEYGHSYSERKLLILPRPVLIHSDGCSANVTHLAVPEVIWRRY